MGCRGVVCSFRVLTNRENREQSRATTATEIRQSVFFYPNSPDDISTPEGSPLSAPVLICCSLWTHTEAVGASHGGTNPNQDSQAGTLLPDVDGPYTSVTATLTHFFNGQRTTTERQFDPQSWAGDRIYWPASNSDGLY